MKEEAKKSFSFKNSFEKFTRLVTLIGKICEDAAAKITLIKKFHFRQKFTKVSTNLFSHQIARLNKSESCLVNAETTERD